MSYTLRILLAILISTTFSIPAAHSLQWSEVMFNPLGNDNGREFIELAGADDLQGCVVSDSASSDKLLLNRSGSSTALILESDHLFSDEELHGATIYTVGAAIGNGLGNTADNITISCNGSGTSISMAYNVSLLQGYREGQSLVYRSAWEAGPMNGTPGVRDAESVPNVTNTTVNSTDSRENGGSEQSCDETLIIALNVTQASAGDHALMTIASAGYASYDITVDRLPFESGDTLTTRKRTIVVPEGRELKIVASMEECGGRQRATRYLRIAQRNSSVAAANSSRTANISIPLDAAKERHDDAPNLSSQTREQRESAAAAEHAAATIMQPASPAPMPAGMAVVDEDADAIPWIAGFGIVTVMASVTVFLQLLRRGQL